MPISTLPFLAVAVFGFLLFQTRRLYLEGFLQSPQRNWINALVAILLGWGVISGYLAESGIYASPGFLSLAPGFWLPFVPVVMALAMVVLVPSLRQGLRVFVDRTPVHWLTGIHQLRVLALGSIIKAAYGLFPAKFAWYVGIPDFLFGISAVLLTLFLVRHRGIPAWKLAPWHLAGAMVVLIPAIGLMHVYMREPLFTELFAFPMALAPTLVVPTFIMLNMLVVWRLLEQRTARSR